MHRYRGEPAKSGSDPLLPVPRCHDGARCAWPFAGARVLCHGQQGCAGKAATKGLFSRAAKQPVTLPPDLILLIETQLARRVADYISMARKAGDAICGFEKVKDWLNKDKAEVLIQASDGSERGKDKLYPPDGPDSLIGCLTAGELGLAFGGNVRYTPRLRLEDSQRVL